MIYPRFNRKKMCSSTTRKTLFTDKKVHKDFKFYKFGKLVGFWLDMCGFSFKEFSVNDLRNTVYCGLYQSFKKKYCAIEIFTTKKLIEISSLFCCLVYYIGLLQFKKKE